MTKNIIKSATIQHRYDSREKKHEIDPTFSRQVPPPVYIGAIILMYIWGKNYFRNAAHFVPDYKLFSW